MSGNLIPNEEGTETASLCFDGKIRARQSSSLLGMAQVCGRGDVGTGDVVVIQANDAERACRLIWGMGICPASTAAK